MKALRVLLVLAAFLAIVPTQTGGALAVDELGLGLSDTYGHAGIGERSRDHVPAKVSHRAHFVAPDDGTAAGLPMLDVRRRSTRAKIPFVQQPAVASVSVSGLERPPRSV